MTTTKTTKAVEAATATAKTAFEEGAKASRAGAEKADRTIDQYVSLSRAQFEKAAETSAKALDELQGLAKGNVDAGFAAAETLIKGLSGLNRAAYAYQLEAMQQAFGTFQALLTARTVNEAVDLQQRYARAAFDGAVAESTRFSGMGIKVANDAIAPIAARVNLTVERIAKPAA